MPEYSTPRAQYAITLKIESPHQPGQMAKVVSAIAEHGGAIGSVDLVKIRKGRSLRNYSVDCPSTEQADKIVEAVKAIAGITVHSATDNTLLMHVGGKLEIRSKVKLKTRADLSMAYTPGVARVCRAIEKDPVRAFDLTIRKNMVAIISDGSAVLGLGDIGPRAAMPVMEGKAILFKEFAGVDAFPLCVDSKDPDDIIDFCKMLAPTFGGINLEDISAPRCFEIEQTLRETLDIPVFHDDQHGTAVVVLAGLINALKVVNKKPQDLKVVVSGAGAAGVACTRIFLEYGIQHVVVCDSQGAIHRGRQFRGNATKIWLSEQTNPQNEQGGLSEVIGGADLFLGVSRPGVMTPDDVKKMNPDPIIFALSNPNPEIKPELIADLAAVIGTGRSDYPNQINNVLAFPGIFRGALDARASDINEQMKCAAATAIAEVIDPEDVSADYIIPSIFDRRVTEAVARAVMAAAIDSGVAHSALTEDHWVE